MEKDIDDVDELDAEKAPSSINQKKILLFLIPLLILIGIGVGMISVFSGKEEELPDGTYNIIKNIIDQDGQSVEKITVFYDLPEVTSTLKSYNKKERSKLSVRLSLELNKVEDIKPIEALIPRIKDAILSHTIELTDDDINNSAGLYWLKEELLYRINLLVHPVKINSLNFKNFEIVKEK